MLDGQDQPSRLLLLFHGFVIPGRHCGSHLVQELANLIIEVRGRSCCLLVAKWANAAVAELASSAPGWLASSVQERPALCA